MDALDAATRERLVAVADLLVPAADGMPSASEVDVVGRWLDRVLDADPSLIEPVAALADCATWDALEARAEIDPATFELGAFAIVAAYYLHPGVRRRMGYTGQGPSPILEGEADWYLRDDILAPVRARGPVFVPTPDA
jgi:hypothetical protein